MLEQNQYTYIFRVKLVETPQESHTTTNNNNKKPETKNTQSNKKKRKPTSEHFCVQI